MKKTLPLIVLLAFVAGWSVSLYSAPRDRSGIRESIEVEQQELQQYIEDALDTTAVPVALGIFYVFRDPADMQDFLSARSRRAID